MGSKVLSVFLILVIVFSNGFLTLAQIALAAPTGENKTFYFRNQSAQLADSHILSTTPPLAGNSQVTSIASTDSPTFRHFHPGTTNPQHIFTTEPAHNPPADSASWISDTPLNGAFQSGSWRFIVHKNDNIKGEVSVPHFNIYSSTSNTSLDQATFLFDVEGPDWWTSSDEQLNFSTSALSQFELNNAYLVVQLLDHCKSGCNGGKIMTVFEDGSTGTTQTRIETPLFVSAGSNEPVPPPPAPAPEPPAPQPPTPPADTTAPVITILGDNPVTVFLGSTYIDAGATAQDNIDGAVSVETTNAVNTAVPAIRTVNVVAPPAPVPPPPAPAPEPPAPELPAPQPPTPPAPAPDGTGSASKNSPPVVEPIQQQTITVGAPVSFKVIATDPDGDPLIFSLGPNAPVGATIDPKTGVFSWLPQVLGTTNFDILVSDGVNTPVTTGHLIENRNLGPDDILGTADDIFIGGMATWGMVKAQARDFLGILLDDMDALDLPLLATDAYGKIGR